MSDEKNPAAVALGRLGGLAGKGISTPKKTRAARRNGKLGGRPKVKKPEVQPVSVVDAIRHAVAEFTDATALLAASHQTVKDRKHALLVRESYRMQAPLDVGVLLDEVDRLEGLLAQQGALATPGAP